jgi:uncharacterized protein DUF1488
MTDKLGFTKESRWIGSHDVVEFHALAGEKNIRCTISLEALCDNFEGDNKEPLECFEKNKPKIEAIATKLIVRRRFERDGGILIRSADC